MRIVHACHGKFHHQDLARQLYERGMLERFFTGYPKWKLKNQNLPLDRISTFPWIETPYMALLKTPLMRGALEREAFRLLMDTFDRYVARCMPECDVFIGMSGAGLRAGRRVQQGGGLYACDRGSAHILAQDRLLREEYARHGYGFPGIDPRIIEQEKREYEQADVITVPSEFARRTFLEQGVPPEKMVTVPYGVDVLRFRKVREPSPGQFDVVFVGGVTFQKGVPDLLKGFRMLKHPKKKLTVVGAIGEEMGRYLACNPPPDNVFFLGHIPQTRLPEIFSRSHVMVLPSIQDGFGLVMAQALACGCPVIATEHTGARDLFEEGKHGFIVPIRGPDAIAERLQQLANDPELRARMSAAGLSLTKTRLNGWGTYGALMVAELERRRGVQFGYTRRDVPHGKEGRSY